MNAEKKFAKKNDNPISDNLSKKINLFELVK